MASFLASFVGSGRGARDSDGQCLDQTERAEGRARGHDDTGGQGRGRHLMPGVTEEAGQPDACGASRQPPRGCPSLAAVGSGSASTCLSGSILVPWSCWVAQQRPSARRRLCAEPHRASPHDSGAGGLDEASGRWRSRARAGSRQRRIFATPSPRTVIAVWASVPPRMRPYRDPRRCGPHLRWRVLGRHHLAEHVSVCRRRSGSARATTRPR